MTNYDLEKIVDTSHDWIVSRTGIHSRRIADENIATSDLSTEAAKQALERANIKAEQLDLIIVATVTPDMLFPSTACLVQSNLGAKNAAAFDLEAACSGFLYSVAIADQFIRTGVYNYVLVIGAETLSKIMNWKDRNTCILFGDGAGAVVLGPTEEERGIMSTYLGADGNGGKFLSMPGGGSRNPASIQSIEQDLHYIHMEGNEVFKFAVRIMAEAAEKALDLCGLGVDDINYLVPHQANTRIITSAAKRLKLHMDKVYVNLDVYGNMSAASVPVALDEALMNGKIKKGDNVVLVAFGGGLTWGSCVIKW
ncbi:MAG: ketoacyl-ACP synthase III [Clostridia bacterium]|nr:ketoacyl-ACP synthase III [Clostridia bacterium]